MRYKKTVSISHPTLFPDSVSHAITSLSPVCLSLSPCICVFLLFCLSVCLSLLSVSFSLTLSLSACICVLLLFCLCMSVYLSLSLPFSASLSHCNCLCLSLCLCLPHFPARDLCLTVRKAVGVLCSPGSTVLFSPPPSPHSQSSGWSSAASSRSGNCSPSLTWPTRVLPAATSTRMLSLCGSSSRMDTKWRWHSLLPRTWASTVSTA